MPTAAPSTTTDRQVTIEGHLLEVTRTHDPLTHKVTLDCFFAGTDAPAISTQGDYDHPAYLPNGDEEHLVAELTDVVQYCGWDWRNEGFTTLAQWIAEFAEPRS